MSLDQSRAPIVEALIDMKADRIVPFDVPGHKRGKGNPELVDLLGEKCLSLDVNSMKPLDNLGHPVSIIQDAELLAAQAFQAKHAFFIVNGTTAAVQAMILFAIKPNEKIILPRNVHKSVINALILNGGIPVYISPKSDEDLEISLGISVDAVARCIQENPDAKAILLNNPTYYGICCDVQAIAALAHEHGLLVLTDEAHGAHLYFGENLPLPGIKAGADLAAISMHKSGSSLTQSSFLLIGEGIDTDNVRQVINLTQTTSASYLLMASLDLSRKNLALHGKAMFERVIAMASYARQEINHIGGYDAYSQELVDGVDVYDVDPTKLVVNTTGIGLSGIRVYDLLRDEYDIQIEFGDTANILAYISVGDRAQDIERLIGALAEIKRRFGSEKLAIPAQLHFDPIVVLSPRDAFYRDMEVLPLEACVGHISGESVMCYPPGIPIFATGERITQDQVDYLNYARESGCFVSGSEDKEARTIRVIKEVL